MKKILSVLLVAAALCALASCQAYSDYGRNDRGITRTYGTPDDITYGTGYGTGNGTNSYTNNGTANNSAMPNGRRNVIDYNTGSGNYRTDNYGNVTSLS